MSAIRETPGQPRPDDTKTDDETRKVHRAETKTRTPVEAKRALSLIHI